MPVRDGQFKFEIKSLQFRSPRLARSVQSVPLVIAANSPYLEGLLGSLRGTPGSQANSVRVDGCGQWVVWRYARPFARVDNRVVQCGHAAAPRFAQQFCAMKKQVGCSVQRIEQGAH